MGLNPIGVTIVADIRKEKSSEGHGFESHRGHYYLLLFIAVRKKKVLLAYEHTTRPTDEGNDKLR